MIHPFELSFIINIQKSIFYFNSLPPCSKRSQKSLLSWSNQFEGLQSFNEMILKENEGEVPQVSHVREDCNGFKKEKYGNHEVSNFFINAFFN